MFTRIRVELDEETLRLLREVAREERRPAADQAAIVLTRAMARRRGRTNGPDGKPGEPR
jgi:hypothetical protein